MGWAGFTNQWLATFLGKDQPAAAPVAAAPKYRNEATNGYASKREATRAAELHLLEKAGQIRNLREQVTYVLIPAQYLDGECVEKQCTYTADFVYEKPASESPQLVLVTPWSEVVEDAKGVRTQQYVMRRKLMLSVHGIRVNEV